MATCKEKLPEVTGKLGDWIQTLGLPAPLARIVVRTATKKLNDAVDQLSEDQVDDAIAEAAIFLLMQRSDGAPPPQLPAGQAELERGPEAIEATAAPSQQ